MDTDCATLIIRHGWPRNTRNFLGQKQCPSVAIRAKIKKRSMKAMTREELANRAVSYEEWLKMKK